MPNRKCDQLQRPAGVRRATQAEIEEAVHYTKLVSGWSVYINGLQVNYDDFAAQVGRVVEHIQKQAA